MTKTRKKNTIFENKSYSFLLPMIGYSLGLPISQFFDLRGVFILNDKYPEMDIYHEVLHLVFEFKSQKDYDFISTKLEPNLLQHYQEGDFYYIYIVSLPSEFKKDYYKFIDSQYSKMTEKYKKIICEYFGYKDGRELDPNTHVWLDWRGAEIVRVLYKRELGYISMENYINKGLPDRYWTYIPRGQEIGRRWDENSESIKLETLNEDKLK